MSSLACKVHHTHGTAIHPYLVTLIPIVHSNCRLSFFFHDFSFLWLLYSVKMNILARLRKWYDYIETFVCNGIVLSNLLDNCVKYFFSQKIIPFQRLFQKCCDQFQTCLFLFYMHFLFVKGSRPNFGPKLINYVFYFMNGHH